MSELEHCRLAYEGKIDLLKHKLEAKKELASKKDQVILLELTFFKKLNVRSFKVKTIVCALGLCRRSRRYS